MVSCSWGWPWAPEVAENDLEPLIFLSYYQSSGITAVNHCAQLIWSWASTGGFSVHQASSLLPSEPHAPTVNVILLLIRAGQGNASSLPSNIGSKSCVFNLQLVTYVWEELLLFSKIKITERFKWKCDRAAFWALNFVLCVSEIPFSHWRPCFCLRKILFSFYTWSDGSSLVAVSMGPVASIFPREFHIFPKHTSPLYLNLPPLISEHQGFCRLEAFNTFWLNNFFNEFLLWKGGGGDSDLQAKEGGKPHDSLVKCLLHYSRARGLVLQAVKKQIICCNT